MSKVLTTLKENSDWIWRIVVFLMLVVSLYLSQTYVTRVEYKEDQARVFSQLQTEQLKVANQLQLDQTKFTLQLAESDRKNLSEHSEISKSLILINQTLAVMGNISDRLSDHESRMRAIEKVMIELNVKVNDIGKLNK